MDSLITTDDTKREADDEVEMPIWWIQDVSKEEHLKAEEVEETKDFHFPKILTPDFVPKVEADSSSALLNDCLIKSEPLEKMDSLITVGDIKKEIDDKVKIPVRWIQDVSKEEHPLVDLKVEELDGTEALDFPKVEPAPKVEAASSSALLHDCPIKSENNPPEKMDSLITTDDTKREADDEVEMPIWWIQAVSKEEPSLADLKPEVEETKDSLIPYLEPKVEDCPIKPETNPLEVEETKDSLIPYLEPKVEDCPIKPETNPLEELEVKKDLVLFQDIKPVLSPKEEDELSNHDCKIESEENIELQEIGVIQDLLPKIRIEAPPREVKREVRILLKRISVPVPRVVSPCEVRQTVNKKNDTRNIEEEKTVPPKKLSRSSYRKNLKTSSFNENVPNGKQYNTKRPFKCKECLYTSARLFHLKNHMSIHTGERPIKCKECSYTCAHSGYLKQHMITHTGERPFKCNDCQYACARLVNLKRHIRTHTGERPFKCKECLYTSACSSYLKQHMTTHTGQKPFKCRECSFTCVCSSNLTRHMKTHTRERLFKCNECLYTCVRLAQLKQHIRTHTGEKPFKCHECEYSCVDSSSLTRHMRIHTGERPFKCKKCLYTCTNSSLLKRHEQTHTGGRPFKCKECLYTYTRSSNLKQHMRTHTGERPFKCKECIYTCATSRQLKHHIQTHTGDI